MNNLTLDQFLALPWSANVRDKLRVMAEQRPDVLLLVASRAHNGVLKAHAFTDYRATLPTDATDIWYRPGLAKPRPKPRANQAKGRTLAALDLVAQGMTPHAAAKQAGVHVSAVYRAQERLATRPICGCCGQVIRDGFGPQRSS